MPYYDDENVGDKIMGKERRYGEDLQRIRDFRLIDDDFKDLPETYVIFITENDVIGDNLPTYTIERQIRNTGQPFNDGEHIVYVNGADRNNATVLTLD